MFIVEGGLSFDTRQGVAGARAFQNELKKTSQVAELASRSGRNIEESFSSLGSERTRGAVKNLARSLASAKDATEATGSAAKALQTAFVRSLTGTALVGGATALAGIISDVGAKIGSAADESARAMRSMKGFAQSLEEGRQRSEAFSQSADNTLKSLEGLKNAGIFQAGVFKLFGGDKVLKDLEETTRGLATAEFGAGAAAGRRTAEARVGMTPEQIADDKRKKEEEQRLKEAREKGGASAEADVAATIAAENEQERILKGRAANDLLQKDLADNEAQISQLRESAEEKTKQAQLDQLTASARLVELEKDDKDVAEKLASIKRKGIFGTEQARRKQLQEILKLEQRSLSIADQKKKAVKEQKEDEKNTAQREADDKIRKLNSEIDEIKRQRESDRKQAENRIEMARIANEERRARVARVQQVAFRGSGILGASRAGRQELATAQKRRQREVERANFKTLEGGGATGFYGKNKNPGLLQQVADEMNAEEKRMGGSRTFGKSDARKRIAEQQAAMQMPFLSEQLIAGSTGGSAEDLARFGVQQKQGAGTQDLVGVLERLVAAMEQAPYVTSGSGR